MSSEYFELLRLKNNAMAESLARKLKESSSTPSQVQTDVREKQLWEINLLIQEYLSEMTEWEVSWCYSNKHFLINNPNATLSKRAAEKLAELIEMYDTEER